MKKLWFVLDNQIVSGPFTSDEIYEGYRTGHFHTDAQVWWKGQRFWIPVSQWMTELPNIMQALESKSTPKNWYYSFDGQSYGPMSKPELVNEIKKYSDYSRLQINHNGSEDWHKLFEFQELLSELGMNRRQHYRAPILGEVSILRHQDKFVGRAASISVGGIGVIGVSQLTKGEEVQMVVRSSLLASPIRTHAIVASVDESGFVGFQFTSINSESKAIISDYVKQFEAQVEKENLIPTKKIA